MIKKRNKWKIFRLSLLGIIIVGTVAITYEYNQLKPENHFSTVPIVGETSNNKVVVEQRQVETENPKFNVLLIGSDERKGQNIGHSDSMILVHVDINEKRYKAVSIPRDTRVYLDGYGFTKLTSVQYIMQANKGQKEGIEAAVTAVSELLGVPINYYVETNYSGFQAMVNAMEGIEINVPFDVKLTHPWNAKNKDRIISAGVQELNGEMVTELVHERYSLSNGEYGRQQLQVEAMKGIAKKTLNPSNINKLPSLIDSIPEFIIASNMSTSDMLSLGLAAKDFDPNTQLEYTQLKGEGKTMFDDILKANNSQIILNKQELEKIATNFK